jgi:cysteine desulfurase
MSVYLDCNATTPIDPLVREEVLRFMVEDFGNAGSRTHQYGLRAKKASEQARDQVAELVHAKRDEVIFTSGATESNNLALLGLADHGLRHNLCHIISSKIEHKAVLEPLQRLEQQGFEVTLLDPEPGGWVSPSKLVQSLRKDTLLVSLMHVNNETGIIQPLEEYISALEGHKAFFHVDAAQSFGKLIDNINNSRIDLISISGHKIYAPKGIGALVTRRRGYSKVPLLPLMVGGGQERGLRPGTLPVHLVVGLGKAAEQARLNHKNRKSTCIAFGETLREQLAPLNPIWVGEDKQRLYNTASLRFPGMDSEAIILKIKELISISNGSACTSNSYRPSHVMLAMGLSEEQAQETLRFSWCHMTPSPSWSDVRQAIKALQPL